MSEQSETHQILQAYTTAAKEIDDKYFSPFIKVLDRLLTGLNTHFHVHQKRILVFSYIEGEKEGEKGRAELRKLLSIQRTLLSQQKQNLKTSFLRINQDVYLEAKKG